ncbi:unnamed protein product [Lathyrus sativus]|nr:unnamed protein product [Lathyrus sativus]
MELKLDMAKAYDRLEWPFIREVLSSMGFPPQFMNLVMRCVTTVSYRILVNGQPSSSFQPERGIRQGDPLSPYLCILCANILSGLLKVEVPNKGIHGVQVARSAPVILHLSFDDDSLLFARANAKEADCLLGVLRKYQAVSGQ